MSVSTPSGVSSAPPQRINVDALMELLQSGKTASEQIAAYQAAKAGADKALAELSLGRSVQAAQEEALQAWNDATALKEKAAKEAAAIIDSAKAQALATAAEAEKGLLAIADEIKALKASHTKWVEKTKAEADARRREAAVILADAEKVKAAHDAAMADVAKARAELAKKHAEADAALKSANAKSKRLRDALDAI